MLPHVLHGFPEQPDQRVAGDAHVATDLGDRSPFEIPHPERFPLIGRELLQGAGQPLRLFTMNRMLTRRGPLFRLVRRIDLRPLPPGGSLPGVQLIPDCVPDVVNMDLSKPGDELWNVFAVEFGDPFVNGKAGLLDQIAGIETGVDSRIELPVGQLPKIVAMGIEQFSQCGAIAKFGAAQQLSSLGIVHGDCLLPALLSPRGTGIGVKICSRSKETTKCQCAGDVSRCPASN